MKNAFVPSPIRKTGGSPLGIVAERYASLALDPTDPCHPSLADPDYDPDGLSTVEEHRRRARLGSHLVILPMFELNRLAAVSMRRLGELLATEPMVALVEALNLAQLKEYDEIVIRVRQMLLEAWPNEDVNLRIVHQFLDVLADLHANIMQYFHRLYHKPYRLVKVERLIASDGLVLRVFP